MQYRIVRDERFVACYWVESRTKNRKWVWTGDAGSFTLWGARFQVWRLKRKKAVRPPFVVETYPS